MGIPSRWTLPMVFVVAIVLHAGTAAAIEDVGTARWQLAPHCNVVTLGVEHAGPVYTLSGWDDN